jgi:hypothetical protein
MVSGKAQNEREMDYKNHHIEVSVQRARDGSGWMPDVFIKYYENGKSVLESLRMEQTFATPNEAEQGGVEYAKKWIDDRKPDL